MNPSSALRQPPACDRWLDNFERQAALTPSRTAVIHGSRSMTYGELSVRSNHLAGRLRSRGIGRGTFIGLGLPASLDLPVALLGIIKSGAAYMPLDPAYPADRIGRSVAAAGIRHVVTRPDLTTYFANLDVIHLGDADKHHSSSGSQPRWYSIELETGDNDKSLVISPSSFDLTRKNFFTPLITGGTLVLDDSETHDAGRIFPLVRDLAITLIQCPTAAFHALLDAAATDAFTGLASLRFVLLDGSLPSINQLRQWLEHPACQSEIIHSSGPVGGQLVHRLHRGNLDDLSPIPKSPIHPEEHETAPEYGTLSSAMEARILTLWSEVLDRPLADPTANILNLGGNAIHLAVIHARLMEMTARRFPMDSLTSLPSARATAEFLTTGKLPLTAALGRTRVRKAHAGFAQIRRPVAR